MVMASGIFGSNKWPNHSQSEAAAQERPEDDVKRVAGNAKVGGVEGSGDSG
jgi:hypothetical protein